LEERVDALGRVFEVVSVNGEVITITDGYSEVEVTENEIEII